LSVAHPAMPGNPILHIKNFGFRP